MRKLFSALLIIAVLGFCRSADNAQGNRDFQIVIHNINQVEMSVSNFGKFGQTQQQEAGCWWPKGSFENYIFGAGPWFGTIDGVDTLVTIGYGPHGAETEYGPGLTGWTTSDPQAIIFIDPETWNLIDYNRLPMAPHEKKSHEDSWCCYNDGDVTWHTPGDTRPIGLEVYQTVYAWNLSTTDDIIFIKYELKNVSEHVLEDCYFGVCADNDIGNESGTGNDQISAIPEKKTYIIDGDTLYVDNLGYQWQVGPEAGWDRMPGTIGFDYLQSPWDLVVGEDKDNDGIPDESEMDSMYYKNNLPDSLWDVDQDGTMDWLDPSQIPQIGMTAFKRFTLNLEPNKDNERYLTLAGYNFKTLAYEPFDILVPDPDDQRFLQCSGPFELDTNEIAVVLVGIIFAEWQGICGSPDTALVELDNTCQFIYDMNWLLPGPPPSPTLSCIPGDKQVTLVWDNKAEIYPDPYYEVVHFADPGSSIWDPYYREYDFEGVAIWKSPTGQSGSWEKLATYDLINDVEYTYAITATDTIVADNGGLVHSFVDTDVRNGFTYYYAVTAFDYNRVKGYFDSIYVDTFYVQPDSDTLWDYDTIVVMGSSPVYFQSGLSGVPVVPRRDAANFVSGTFSLTAVSGNPLLPDSNVDIAITNPIAMDSTPLFLEFGPIAYSHFTSPDTSYYSPVYTAAIKNTSDETIYAHSITVIKTAEITEGIYEFPPLQGLSIGTKFVSVNTVNAASIFDTIIRQTGSYPDTLLRPRSNTSSNWAYRGNDYEIHWIRAHGSDSVNSVVVIDAMSGDTIPYRASYQIDSLFDGWCFEGTGNPKNADTLVFASTPIGTRYIYVNGGWIALKKGSSLRPGDPRPGLGDIWIAHANPAYPPACVNARIQINSVPAAFSDSAMTLNVKVVPNPYIITNEWQQSFRLRRLRFINLPNKCTLRIFNINGELIRTILHYESVDQNNPDNIYGGDEWWDLLSANRQLIASGIYIFHVDSDVGEQVGKFVVVR